MRSELSWKPSVYTKICSDHFYAEDFVEADVERLKEGIAYQSIRLKSGSLPRTDRATGYMVDPKLPLAKHERSVRVVAEATSNLVHQIFVDIYENPVEIEENPVHIIFVRAELNEDRQQDNMNNEEL